MSRLSFGMRPGKKPCDLRDVRGCDVVVVVVMVVAVGGPLALAQTFLLKSFESAFSSLASPAVSADVLTLGGMTAFCAVLGLAMFVGNRFLRRFLNS